MARILVTGASGFVGHAVVAALVARGDEVIATDVVQSSRLARLVAESRGRIAFTAGEITEWPLAMGLMRNGYPNKVVHCAALVGVPASVCSPVGTFRVNIEGTINVLEAMRFAGVKRMVNISSEEIYGPFLTDVIDEDHRCLPTKPYGISKFVVEQVCRDYAEAYGLECIHARTCWVYGPYFPRPRMPRNLLDAAIAGRPLHLPCGADYAVDQVHVEDVVQGVLKVLDKEDHAFDAYHITTGKAVSFREIVDMIRQRLPNADISIDDGPLRFVDGTVAVRKGALAIDRARHELGYNPLWTMQRGLNNWIDVLERGSG